MSENERLTPRRDANVNTGPVSLQALEPRMMFDGAAVVTADATLQHFTSQPTSFDGTVASDRDTANITNPVFSVPSVFHTQDLDRTRQDAAIYFVDAFGERGGTISSNPDFNHAVLSEAAEQSNSIIFIDTAVDGYEQLAAEWANRGTVVLIDSSRDGIEQMLAALSGRTNLDAIHIVSHGAANSFFIGTTAITSDSVTGNLAGALAMLGSKLSHDGDILIYGCDVNWSDAEQDFVGILARATGADVAASMDATGAASMGGDWDLEARSGNIESSILVSEQYAETLQLINSGTWTLGTNSASTVIDGITVTVSWTNVGSSTWSAPTNQTFNTIAAFSNAADGDPSLGLQWNSTNTTDISTVTITFSQAVINPVLHMDRLGGTSGGANSSLWTILNPSASLTSLAGPSHFQVGATTITRETGVVTAGAESSLTNSTGTAAGSVRINGTYTTLSFSVRMNPSGAPGIGDGLEIGFALDAPPDARDDSATIPHDTALSGNLFANNGSGADSDIRNDVLTIDRINGAAYTVGTPIALANGVLTITNATTGAFTFVPSANFVGTQTFTYRISDAHGNNDSATVTINVTNIAPTLDLDASGAGTGFTTNFVENGSAVSIADTDAVITDADDTQMVSASVTLTNPQAGDILLVNGSTAATGTLPGGISYTLTATGVTLTGAATRAQYAAAIAAVQFRTNSENPSTTPRTINVVTNDGNVSSNVAVATINVTAVNDAPVASNDGPLTTAEDTPINNINVLANDTDVDGGPLTVTSATATNGTVTINPDGTLNYTPNVNFSGTETITYTISDGRGGTSTATVTINVTPVNDAPTAVGSLPPRTNLDGTSGINVTTAGGFADVDGPTATYSATGLPAGLSINATTGVITGTIDRSASQTNGGIYNVVVTRSDGSLSATQAFSWTVTNPAPIATNDSLLTVNEDTAGTTVNVLANDSDPDGDPLTITGASATNGTVVINANGTLTFTPNANYNGSATITYTISDGQGGTATATVPVTVVAVNDAPVATPIAPQSTSDGATISVPVAGNFSDIDGGPLSFSAAGLPAGLSIDPVTGLISGTIAPNASQTNGGVYTATITVSDGNGGTVTQTITFNVANPPPTATNDTAATSEDSPVTISPLANDTDPDGDPLTIVSASAPNGTVTINPDGTVTYTPNPNFNGTDTVTYTISDGNGGTSTATITVTVGAVNDAPTPVGTLPPRTNVDAQAGINVPTAGGFTDVDNATLSYSATGLPAGLSINAATGVITGTIDPAASQGGAGGVYSVTVTATDAGGLTATQTFSWTVTNPAPVAVNDAATTNEDTPILIPVLPNDSDPDGDPLTVISASASVGIATIVGNQVQYTPPANFNGTATITYTISDGNGGTSTATITVTVNPVNDAPVATPIAPQNTSDGATISVPVAGNFSDVDGNTLSYSATGLPAGLSIDPVTGVISGTIAADASQTNGGVYTATITVSDGNGGTVTQTITFNVANPAPTAANDSASTPEDTPVTISPLANDTDPDGDPLTITSASALNGTVTVNPDGTVTYTPNPGFNGTDTITYTISDGNGGTSTATITIAVADVNDAPVTSGSIGNQTNLDSQTVNLPVSGAFSDPDGDALTFAAAGLPAGLTINPATGVISGTIDHSASQVNGGVYAITVTASDGRGGIVTQTFSWTVTNPAPGAVNDNATTNEDTAVQIPVLANDVDPDGDPLTVTAASAGNGTVVILPNGALQYTPNPNFNGTDTIFYTITDSEGGVSTATVNVTVSPVNDTPTTVGLPNQNGDDGAAVSFSVASAFGDPDGDPLTFSATGLPPNLTIDPATGLISGVLDPSTSQNGPYVVTVTATDPSGAEVTTSFVYSVQNIPPVATNDTASTPEDVPVQVAVLTNDSDPDGDPLTITSASANNGTVVVNPDGTLTFTPAPNFNGIATVSYTVSDGNGGVATATLTIDVGAVNDAPTSLPIPNQASTDGAFYSANTAPFFSDVDGDTLAFSATGLPAGLSIDPATGVVSGTIDPNASQINGGVYTVTITATDPSGATTSRTLTATITNPAPTAVADAATTAEDTPIPAINVLGNDTDPDGDPLTVTAAIAPNGTVTINPDNTLNYVPNPNFNGTDIITYTISDGDGGFSTATVTVTVTSVNDAPVAVNDSATTNEDQPVTIGVLGNDSDVDGDPLTVTAASSPNGTVVINPDGTISFTPAPNFNGPTTITYTISDGNGGTATATVNVTVNAVNDAPVANPSTATTNEDTPVTVPVLANDTDIDGDPLTVTAASAPNGTVTINPDGTVTYTPNANFNGTDTITYTISDGQGGFSTSTVTVTVNAVNDAPTATPIAPQVDNDNDAVNVPVAGNFSDLDGNTLTFTATGLPAGLSISPTGVITGTIDRAASQGGPNADGIYSVTVTASDGNGGTVSQTFSWTVENPPPVATDDSATTNEDAPVTIAVLTNDSDPDTDPLTITSATSPNGTVVINGDGTITFTPAPNFNGPTTITYTISDGNGGTSTATVAVTVNPINDAPVADTPLPAQTGVDNTPVNIPVAGNFSDLDGDTLTFTATGLPAGLSISPTGVITGTIDRNASQGGPNADGIYTVTVTASDGNGGAVTTTFTYMVTNPAPTAVNDTATTAEDMPVTIAVLANDTDPDGDPLTVTSATSPDGSVAINPDGTITFTPNPNFNGPTTITYAISDGNGGTSTATVSVNVTPVNDAPVVDTPIANQSGVDGTPVNIPVAGNFSDLDGDTLGFSATGLPAGLSIDPATGVISGTVDRNASQVNGGIYTVTVAASDGNGGTVSTTFTYTVTNPGPTAANDTAATNEDVPVTIAVLANDTDPDGDALSVTSATSPNGTVVINPDGTITFTPALNFNGPTTITYTISDGNGGTSTATVDVTVNAVNDAPTADPPLSPQTNSDADPVNINVAPNFADLDGDTLTFSATGLPPGATISAAGVITGPLDNSASQGGPNGDGVYTVTVTASDGNGGTVTSTFVWTVTNPAPVATNDTATTSEDTASAPINVLGNDVDADGDSLTVTSASAPNGTVTINPDGTLVYTPNANFNGTDIVTYTISDGEGGTSTATVTVTVAAANDAPVTSGLPNLFDIDNSVVSVPVGPAFSDAEGDTLTFSAAGLPAGLSINSTTGEIFGQIASNASTIGGGIYTVTVTADDGNGGITSTTFTWTVTNTAPFASDDIASTNEDTPVTFNVLGNDTDPDLDPLTVVSATATNGTVVVNPDGTLTYAPDPDFNGTATVTYLITDGNGGFSTATAVITVAPVNDAPDAAPLPNRSNLDGDTISIPAGAQFSDREGNTLSFSATGLPAGLAIDPLTGVIAGTIDPSASQLNGGVYTVTVTADDGNGGTTSISFVWSIANPGPTAVNDIASTTEDTPTTIAVLANDTDPDNDVLTVTAASAPNGTVAINPDGTITYTPDANFNGTDTITYTISDGNGGTSTATVTVTVAPANDAPTATPLPARANVDGAAVSVPVAGNFSDLDGDTLTFSDGGTLPPGLTIDPVTGIISGTIDPAASQGGAGGIYTVTITANDGNGGTVSTTFSWTVTNPPPVAANDSATTDEDTPVDITVLANDADPDGDPLTVTTASAGNGTVTIGAGGVLTYTPNGDFNGTDIITYTISDGNGGTSTATVTVTVSPINDAPVSKPIAPRTNPDSAIVSVPVAANFSDIDNATFAFSATGLPAGLTIDPATGVINGTIDRNASQAGGGIYSVTVTATDAGGLSTSQTFTWTVTNPPPVAVNDVATTPEDFPVNINVLVNDSDPDGDPLTVTTASAGNGTVTIRPDGTIDYTPNADFNGTDTITYTISDGNGGTSTATVTVTVGPVNDPPVAVNDAASTNEDTPVTVAVLANDSDIDGNPLTVTAATSPDGTVAINPDGTITFTPNANFNGVATISYTISDGQGGTSTATVTVDVNPVNDPPVAVNDNAATPEDTPVTVAVLTNDSDVDGDPLTVTAASSPNGAVTINPNGTITFTPNADFNGPTTVTYTISDGNGGTSTATVTLTVAPVNDVPVANPSTATTNEDTPVILPVLTNDTDADGDPLTVTAASAANGTVTILPDGTVRYVPDPNFNGTDTITYTISDGQGGFATSTVTVTVNPVNDIPVAVNDNAITPEDTPVTIPVLANDSDADGNPLTITAATSPNGTVVINPDGTITFTPNPNFNGPTTISYTISDGQGGTATATVAVNVTPVNDPPVARPDTATTPEDTPVTVAVLGNDSDVDGNPLAVVSASSPNGTVVINPNGTITFTPDPNFNGPTTITYTVSDGQGGTATTTVAVNVTPVNDPPVARNDVFTMDEDTTARIPLLSNDFDLDGDPLTITAASSPNGTVVINADGTVSFTPSPNFFGPATITYTISDGRGGTSTAIATVNVLNTNELPVDGDEAISTIGGVVTTINVLDNATDPERDPVSVFFAEVESGAGTVTINPDGTLNYIAPQDFQGIAVIRYIVSDGRGGFDISFVTITVTQANADMNALLGQNASPGIPDAWRVDEILDQSEKFITVPLIIDQTINDFRSLNGTPSLFGRRPLLDAVNGIDWLRGTPEHGSEGHPISDTVHYLDRIRDLRFGMDRLFDPRMGDFTIETLTGFSVRQLDSGNDQVMIESVVRDQVIYMEVRDIGSDSDPRITEYQLRMRDGSALPEWIRMDNRGLAIIERPVDAEEIRLVVRAIRADGAVIDVAVVVQGATGEIQLDAPLAVKKISAAEPLAKTLAAASAAATDEAARLAAAFNSQA